MSCAVCGGLTRPAGRLPAAATSGVLGVITTVTVIITDGSAVGAMIMVPSSGHLRTGPPRGLSPKRRSDRLALRQWQGGQ